MPEGSVHPNPGPASRTGRDHDRPVLGRGRSGLVYAEPAPDGTPMAVKVFLGDPAADVVNTLLTGAAVPYAWCEDALRCALHRRRILAELVRVWLPGKLRVARALDVRRDPRTGAWELCCERVDGRPAALHHPFSRPTDDEQRELQGEIMRPLQRHLREAGFVGMLWQAGHGNPVAADNFLRDRFSDARWAWIDLESGVPALFPLDPRALVRTYLPWSARNRRLLFDDTDTEILRSYLQENRDPLDRRLGPGSAEQLLRETELLERHQAAWRRLGRTLSGVLAALSAGRIDADQAEYYATRPGSWLAVQARHGARRVIGAVGRSLPRAWRRLRAWTRSLPRVLTRLVVSQRFRARIGRILILRRIRSWRLRGHLHRHEGAYLSRLARHREEGSYLLDFGGHVAIKPAYKAIAWLGLPALAQVGLLPLWALPLAWLMAGSVARTLYTTVRGLGARLRGRPFPWIALGVGALPFVGTAAYPAQIVLSSRDRDGKLAALLLYDTLTTVGRRIPIWGGADSAVEHFFNRLPDPLVGKRPPLLADRSRGTRAQRPLGQVSGGSASQSTGVSSGVSARVSSR